MLPSRDAAVAKRGGWNEARSQGPMDHELRSACEGVIDRIVQLRDSL